MSRFLTASQLLLTSLACFVALGTGVVTYADEAPAAKAGVEDTAKKAAPEKVTVADEKTYCESTVERVVRKENRERLKSVCKSAVRIPTCASVEGRPIQHIDFPSNDARGKNILVLGMIHGDEPLAAELALMFADHANGIKARNSWRVVPMLNPDGLERNTRMNANGVDLNRNFPTRDWDEDAAAFWKRTSKNDPRRFPGEMPGSEAETKCVIQQIKDFRPDFIVSVHTPYKVLDFDGPKMKFPAYKDLPWRALGNFPGSLGRYMWKDYQVPVLTVELGSTMVDAARLQDIVGTFAIEAARRSGTKTAGLFEHL